MSHTVVMETLWPLHVLVVLFSAHAACSHNGLQGLFCVNDFVASVSCTWNSTAVAPGEDCWIHGAKNIWKLESSTRFRSHIVQSCKVKQHGNSPPGCSFVFKDQLFNSLEVMPNISLKCNGKILEVLTNYTPYDHIKMNPPGVPNVSTTANETWISWSQGSPFSIYITAIDFQIEIKLKNQTWKEAKTLIGQEKQLQIPSWQLKGHRQVRVRVRPDDRHGSHWSNWSPTTSWMGATDAPMTSQHPVHVSDQPVDCTTPVVWGVSLGLLFVVLVFYISCVNKGRLKAKPVPSPSKYFPTLQPVHGGNLKKWLNPLSTADSFFTAQPCDTISPVEVCESWDVVPSTSPSTSSTSALLHVRSYTSAGSDTSGIVDNSSSSSFFSNMGYFMSSSSSRTDPIPAYFTYQDDLNKLHNDHNLRLSLCPSLASSRVYESLKREPQSPDSGFEIGQEDEEGMDVEGEMVSDDDQSSPLLILPLHLLSWVCPPSSDPPPPHPPSLAQICSDSQEVEDVPVASACGGYAAWPVAGAMSRSYSVPVESCKTGYLTLKELQTTFSNKSI